VILLLLLLLLLLLYDCNIIIAIDSF